MSLGKVGGLLCAGNICHDILVRPVNEFRWGTNTWVDEMVEDMGGNGSNSSLALAVLGVPVRLLGMVGRDERGEGVLQKLTRAGADVGFVGRSVGPTTVTICVINDKGERLFFQRLGASLEAFAQPTTFDAALTAGHSHYHQANLYSLPNLRHNSAAQMKAAKDAGLTTSLDTGWATDGRWMEVIGPALPYTDLLFVNEDEARMLTSEIDPTAIARVLRQNGATDVILKLGARGCVVFQGATELHVPGYRVEAKDTTGAGDCFAAGFFAALHRGWAFPDAARAANAVGALSVTAMGATGGVRPWAETLAWMESTPVAA